MLSGNEIVAKKVILNGIKYQVLKLTYCISRGWEYILTLNGIPTRVCTAAPFDRRVKGLWIDDELMEYKY